MAEFWDASAEFGGDALGGAVATVIGIDGVFSVPFCGYSTCIAWKSMDIHLVYILNITKHDVQTFPQYFYTITATLPTLTFIQTPKW